MTTTQLLAPLVVDRIHSDSFGQAFNFARERSAQIAAATSPFDVDRDESDTVFRLTRDCLSGYAVRADGELVYVFSLVKGRGDGLIASARADGATNLDCFDGYLPTLYGRHGFVETAREPNWTPGEPDVVWMRLAS